MLKWFANSPLIIDENKNKKALLKFDQICIRNSHVTSFLSLVSVTGTILEGEVPFGYIKLDSYSKRLAFYNAGAMDYQRFYLYSMPSLSYSNWAFADDHWRLSWGWNTPELFRLVEQCLELRFVIDLLNYCSWPQKQKSAHS